MIEKKTFTTRQLRSIVYKTFQLKDREIRRVKREYYKAGIKTGKRIGMRITDEERLKINKFWEAFFRRKKFNWLQVIIYTFSIVVLFYIYLAMIAVFIFKPRLYSSYSTPWEYDSPVCETYAGIKITVPNWVKNNKTLDRMLTSQKLHWVWGQSANYVPWTYYYQLQTYDWHNCDYQRGGDN